jgi:hypothetical protein
LDGIETERPSPSREIGKPKKVLKKLKRPERNYRVYKGQEIRPFIQPYH